MSNIHKYRESLPNTSQKLWTYIELTTESKKLSAATMPIFNKLSDEFKGIKVLNTATELKVSMTLNLS